MGFKPFFPVTDQIPLPETRSIMTDPRYQPTLLEGLAVGVGKAHRSVNYAHYEFRNYQRGRQLRCSGRVGRHTEVE
jgi:hypothetical protein